jgi:hypothetical protein
MMSESNPEKRQDAAMARGVRARFSLRSNAVRPPIAPPRKMRLNMIG